jgi:hypothetical protein
MTIEMLEAVSEMLEESKEVKVVCGKTLLNKIITGLKSDSTSITTLPKSKTLQNKDAQYKVVVDELGKLVSIDGLESNSLVEVDGLRMTYAEAIGKTFNKGRII